MGKTEFVRKDRAALQYFSVSFVILSVNTMKKIKIYDKNDCISAVFEIYYKWRCYYAY